MRSYGVVKQTFIQQSCNFYNVKLYQKIDPNIQVDKIQHPPPIPKQPNHLVSRIIQQRPHHVIQRNPKEKPQAQDDIFDHIIASNIRLSQNKNKLSIAVSSNEKPNGVSRQTLSVERYTRKPIFYKKHQQNENSKKLLMPVSNKEPNLQVQSNKSEVKQLDRSHLSTMMGNKRSIFSLQNKLYHEVMIPAYERITKQLQSNDKEKPMILQSHTQRQKSQISRQNSKMTDKNHKNSEKDNINSQIDKETVSKNVQRERTKLKLNSNVTNLQVMSRLQQIKGSLQPIRNQLQRSEKSEPANQLELKRPQARNTKKKQPTFSSRADNQINIQYPHLNMNSHEVAPINIKINITIGNPAKKPNSQINKHLQQGYSSVKSIYSDKISRRSVSSVLNNQESMKRKFLKEQNNNQKQPQKNNFNKIDFKKAKSNSQKQQNYSINGPQTPSILKLKPKGVKSSLQRSNIQSSHILSDSSSISLSVYAIKGINPIII